MPHFDDSILDDPDRILQADPSGLLAMTALAGATIRAAAAGVSDSVVDRIADQGRPRAIVVAGGGGSVSAADLLIAAVGRTAALPVVAVPSGSSLPGWVGGADAVVVVSAGGQTTESVEIAREAARRGCQLVAICPLASDLAELTRQTRGATLCELLVPPHAGPWRARSLVWALATPLVVMAEAWGLCRDSAAMLEATADILDSQAVRCGFDVGTESNPAKTLALELDGRIPLVWATGAATGFAAQRWVRQFAENAGHLAVAGRLPAAARTQGGLLSGGLAVGVSDDELFLDRVETSGNTWRLGFVLLRDSDETPAISQMADSAWMSAHERGVWAMQLTAQSPWAWVRAAQMVALADFGSIYLGLGWGFDPLSADSD